MPFERYTVPVMGRLDAAIDDELARLRAELVAEYDLREVSHRFGQSDFTFLSVLDSYALLDRIDPAAFVKDEQMPYWAEIWPAAVTLSRQIVQTGELAGKSVLELGAGVGMASIAAAKTGARVLCTDYSTEALKFVAFNALKNRVQLDTCRLDWRLVKGDEKFDAVIAADVLYERLNLLPIVTAINALLAPGGSAYIADPRRRLADQFLELVHENGFEVAETRMFDADGDQTVAVTIYKLQRAKV
ncbi:methyltransferase domain-containing protein [Chlorobaculum sp. 24CR]|uniref:class I SAM-dependent methyltransferase n=1 Tax=Chlorobaculum sp. 24CR TaxID=2508878 RepID=UPI00100ACA06|nr:methyltransferase domain-containing protein [Chlorobaculum sp. 24CR]RXK89125.1 methyltransferase domain-containing protein [Chlorobaculum sp. 24CR]